MPATSFTFYGVVEDDQPGSPAVGRAWDAAAYGYTEGQTIEGRLVLTAAGTDAYLDLQEQETEQWLPASYIADFYFERDAIGGFTEADINAAGSFLLGSNGTDLSITDIFLTARRQEADNSRYRLEASQSELGGVRLLDSASGDYGPAAMISGAWIPEGITPNLIYGTDAADALTGQGEVSMLWGGLGADTIVVGSGSGYAWGGQGGDTIRGGAEEDQIWGGLGDDSIQGRGGADHLYGQWGADTIHGGDGDDTIDGGRASEDSDGIDLLQGGAGDDVLHGHVGSADTLLGGADDDIIFSGGGTGPTNLAYSAGGAGDDLLIAQHGWARLSGGNGHDVFQVRPVDALIIEDFKPGVDKLDFDDNPRWDTFGELMGFASQQGADVVFQFDSVSETVTLQNVQMSQLRSADFIF